MKKLVAVCCAALLAMPAAGKALAQDKKGEDAPAAVLADDKERTVSKTMHYSAAGKSYDYTATAGTLTVRDDDAQAVASMFYTAYTRPAAKGAPKRPVTFFFNGGPGSASLWLNIGAFGPRRAPTATPDPTPPAPYALVDNPHTLLDKSDLVFIDAVGTGYSRAIGAASGKDFWGVDPDVDSFARAITRYLTITDHWNAPRFLFGESYGTTRAASLVYRLQNQGLDFNGVVLLSTYLNSATGAPGVDIADINFLPTLAATAWYHNRSATHPAQLDSYLAEVRAFALGDYASALLRADGLSPDEEQAIAQRMSGYTGLSVPYLLANHLRVGMEAFREELLADRSLIVGRFDTRFVGPKSYTVGGGAMDPATNDAATAGVNSAHLSTYRQHLADEIGYRTDLQYRPLYNMVISANWDHRHRAPGMNGLLNSPNTALDLAAAMQRNANLKVLVMGGVYDLATPFAQAEFDISHLYLLPDRRANLAFKHYESGHMTYVDEAVAGQMKVDLDAFYARAAP
ncbi:S10 family peptidase [Novosphingobium aureum]|nr:peptidase S10 [Novosphingobium aureum]